MNRLIFQAPGRVVLEPFDAGEPGPGEISLRTVVSAISAGTESLLWEGLWPENMPLDSVWAPELGTAVYPVAYGYASVGRIDAVGEGVDSRLSGRLAFTFSPHQSRTVTRLESAWLLPEGMSPENGVFLAAMETALSLAQDAAPVRGETAAVWGLGTVGLLTTALLSPSVYAWDLLANRRALVGWGARAERPAPESCDVVVELTGNPSALNEALAAVRFSGRLVLGSWYGALPVEVALGGRFHRSRIDILASQVSTLSPQLSGRWTKERRLKTALGLIAELNPSALVTHRFPFAQASAAYEQACEHPESGVQVLLTY